MCSQLIQLLKTGINPDALIFRGRTARFDVISWYNPGNMQKDYLQNNKLDVLFSVKKDYANMRRFMGVYRKPKTEITVFEVAVWLLDTPAYGRQDRASLRDAAVAEVQRVMQAAQIDARVEAVRVDDHVKGSVWVLCTRIMVFLKCEE
jgi:hypothetical protein